MPKTGALYLFQHTAARRRLADNTDTAIIGRVFQHTAARRRLGLPKAETLIKIQVSTHSRPKAAGVYWDIDEEKLKVSTHSRPKAAGGDRFLLGFDAYQFQHTAARRRLVIYLFINFHLKGFNTQPPEGGWAFERLVMVVPVVSTHSRPKAAGKVRFWA